MNLNVWQKLATAIYGGGLIIILTALTPWVDRDYAHTRVYYGTFFKHNEIEIQYKSLFIEIGVWTVLFLLAVIVFKSDKKKING